MFEKKYYLIIEQKIATIKSVLKLLGNMQHYLSKGTLLIFTCYLAIIEANRIDFHFLKMRVSLVLLKKFTVFKINVYIFP